jgi:hypothetical protein
VFLQDGFGFWELGLDWRHCFLLLSGCFELINFGHKNAMKWIGNSFGSVLASGCIYETSKFL